MGKTGVASKAALLAMSLSLAACGGGGGGGTVRADPPPASPPPSPPPATPPVVGTPDPAFSKHLVVTNTAPAHAAGLTGQNIRIGVVDSGVNRNHPALQGRVLHNLTYIASPPNNLTVDDVVGHGTAVSQIMAGKPFGNWPGGIAPGASIISARIISDTRPTDDGSGQGNEVNGALGLAPIHQDLIDRGAKIMNNSWGGLYWTNPAATAPIADEYRPFIVGNGGLVVFATGNESRPNPSSMAALPSQLGSGGSLPAADLERGWLAVAAVDTDNPTQLASYSNACGVAMNYCLAAPGTVTVTGTNDSPTNPSYWNWSGTSLAAPQVSGAAALVWEAFPYFNNDLVRQTLLGTATDYGDPGVDPVFGYGLLNVGKAVSGPSRFDWGDVTVSFDGITSAWSNEIRGDGGLIKRGSGRLELSGILSYRGQTRIEGGTLATRFNLPAGAFVGTQGSLHLFNAGVHEDLENHGEVAITGSAIQWITGDFMQSTGATLSMQVGSKLYVDGVALISGGQLQISGLVSGYVYSNRELLINAMGGVSGRFDALTQGPGVFLDGSLEYNSNQVLLNITRLDVSAAATAFGNISAASLASASRVENAFLQIDAQQRGENRPEPVAAGFIEMAGELQRSPTQAEAKASLASLSGELHAAADAMTFDAIGMNRRALSSRFDQLVDQPTQRGDWYQRLGEAGRGSYGANDFQMDGWMLGSDLRLSQYGVVGVAFGEIQSHTSVGSSRDRGQDRQAQGQFYMGSVRGNAYALGQLGFGRYDRQLRRELLLGQASHGVASEYAGDFLSMSLETGYRFGSSATALTPYVGTEYARVDRDGFVETGASGFGLKTDASVGERTLAIGGLRAEHGWKYGHGRGFALHGYAEWQETLTARGLGIEASFVGVEAWAPLVGASPEVSGGVFGIGFDAHVSDAVMMSFGYDQSFGPRKQARMMSAKVAFEF
ncbi:S8 family serine peptidase [Pseudoxanthomonas sp. UTMC 1351]|uniref:S8 family serine peptidase n=1 Tax=Pseudoxanthomonas sp. UTMC 1351 TaxID=2695853 RepID=UPI0034D002D0